MSNYEVGIMGIGYALPDHVLTNKELQEKYGFNSEYIEMTFGVKERRVAYKEGKSEPISTFGIKAARAAMEDAGVEPAEIDLMLVSVCTSDYPIPKMSYFIQDELGITNAHIININAACSGSNFGLGLAWRYLKSGLYKKALLIMGDAITYGLGEGNILAAGFGDGSSAAVLAPLKSNVKGILADHYSSDDKYYFSTYAKAPGSEFPLSEEAINKNLHRAGYTKQVTEDIVLLTVHWFQTTLEACLKKANLNKHDIHFFSPHPVSKMQIDAQLASIDVNPTGNQYHFVTDKYGHSSSGTALIVLKEALLAKKISPGDRVFCFSVGSGFVWGGMIIQWWDREKFI
jgi:3-oxoacyl-[acyl-carrier-protein] synthase-3